MSEDSKFDLILSRGNCGVCLIDLAKLKAYKLTQKDDTILKNLYGHGDDLQVYKSKYDPGVFHFATLYQRSFGESENQK